MKGVGVPPALSKAANQTFHTGPALGTRLTDLQAPAPTLTTSLQRREACLSLWVGPKPVGS